MGLLKRRRMMGKKQSESPLIEVENVPVWTGYVTDDARQNGWTLEKPYYFSLNGFATGFDVHGLSDADFMCMDVLDNDTVGSKNLYIPAIGKYSIGMTGTYYNNPIASSEAEQYTWNVENQAYPQTPVYDSLGRKWIKVAITQYDTNRKVICKSQELSIYYCAESDLGQIFTDRRWEKHYTVYPNVKTILNADNNWSNEGGINYYNGLKASDSYSSVISETHFDNPVEANLNGVLQGYLIEVPNSTDQVIIDYADVVGFMGLLRSQNDRPALYQETRITGEITVTNTAELKWITLAVNTTTTPKISVVLVSEW